MSSLEVRATVTRGSFRLDVDFTVPAQGITALFGPSGSGKTSLLRVLAGLEARARGRIVIADEIWQDDAQKVFLPPHRRSLGCVFQEPSLFPHRTVRGNLDYGLRRTPPETRKLRAEEVIAWLGLERLLSRWPDSLSGGEAQRVTIARALLRSPRLLLLDEPLAGLDEPAQIEIFPYLERLHGELAIPMIYVSHASAEVLRLADNVLLIAGGRLRAAGPLAAVSTRLDLVPWAPGQGEPSAVIAARVASHDERFGMTQLEFLGGRLEVPLLPVEIGTPRRLRIAASDVSLALEPPLRTSILNVLPVRVVAVSEGTSPIIQLAAGDTLFLAQVTSKSRQILDIHPGLELYALVKGVAILD